MGPNFDVSAPPTFVIEIQTNRVVVVESVFVLCVFILLIMERKEFKVQYLSIINKINTRETNTDHQVNRVQLT